jgi:hypothetical protein
VQGLLPQSLPEKDRLSCRTSRRRKKELESCMNSKNFATLLNPSGFARIDGRSCDPASGCRQASISSWDSRAPSRCCQHNRGIAILQTPFNSGDDSVRERARERNIQSECRRSRDPQQARGCVCPFPARGLRQRSRWRGLHRCPLRARST